MTNQSDIQKAYHIKCRSCDHEWDGIYKLWKPNWKGTSTIHATCPSCNITVNQGGVRVFVNKCDFCGNDFSVTPYPENIEDWSGCTSPDCSSYSKGRDVDNIFDDCINIKENKDGTNTVFPKLKELTND